MTMIADGHTTIEHSLPVANIYDDVLQFWRGSGTAYTPTMVVTYGGPFGENYWYQHTEVWKEPILRAMDAAAADRRPLPTAGDEPAGRGQSSSPTRSSRSRSRDLGIPVSIGAHGQREGLGAHWDMWSFALGGMKPMDVAAHRHDQPGPRARPRQGAGQHRARQARRPRHARRQPAREYPQLQPGRR